MATPRESARVGRISSVQIYGFRRAASAMITATSPSPTSWSAFSWLFTSMVAPPRTLRRNRFPTGSMTAFSREIWPCFFIKVRSLWNSRNSFSARSYVGATIQMYPRIHLDCRTDIRSRAEGVPAVPQRPDFDEEAGPYLSGEGGHGPGGEAIPSQGPWRRHHRSEEPGEGRPAGRRGTRSRDHG